MRKLPVDVDGLTPAGDENRFAMFQTVSEVREQFLLSRNHWASSPPRPKMHGSPPLSRTTHLP